jgi:hypothetical protein
MDLSWAVAWYRSRFTSWQAMREAAAWGSATFGAAGGDHARWYMVTRDGLGGFEIIAWFRHAEDRLLWQMVWG